MVSEEKIRLMAKAAEYENNGLKRDIFAKRYYKQDYVDSRRLKLGFWATVYYILYWVYFLVKEFYIDNANLLYYDYGALFLKIILGYLILLVAVACIAGFFGGIRYDQAKNRLDGYYELLARINDYSD